MLREAYESHMDLNAKINFQWLGEDAKQDRVLRYLFVLIHVYS